MIKKERSLNEASLSLCYYYCLLGIFLLFFPKHLPKSQTRVRVGDYRSSRTYLNPGAFWNSSEPSRTFWNLSQPYLAPSETVSILWPSRAFRTFWYLPESSSTPKCTSPKYILAPWSPLALHRSWSLFYFLLLENIKVKLARQLGQPTTVS